MRKVNWDKGSTFTVTSSHLPPGRGAGKTSAEHHAGEVPAILAVEDNPVGLTSFEALAEGPRRSR